MIKISLRFIERALFNFHVPFGLMKGRRRRIEILLGRIFLGEKFLRSRGIYFGKLKCGLGGGEIAFGLRDRGLKQGRIDLGDDLPGFHLRIKISEKFLNVTRDLATDLHVDDRIERTRRSNRLCNRAARDRGDLIIFRAAAPALPHHGSDNEQPNDQSDPRDKTFHLRGS